MVTMAVILLGLSLVGIRQATSPPMMLQPLTADQLHGLVDHEAVAAGSMLAQPGATMGSRQSRSKVM